VEVIKSKTGKKSIALAIPKGLVKGIAKLGDVIPLPLNTKRLRKMTGDLLISNAKINKVLEINELPLTAEEGLEITIHSFTSN
ncbi:MAG: hypothetical protein LRY55_00640, partial [Leadbetterella sp.]|nr:hypothetical protein [Leadbetterella sp.]